VPPFVSHDRQQRHDNGEYGEESVEAAVDRGDSPLIE
jgi:hypothetical protein